MLPNRFWNKVDKTDTCWLWTGAKGRGYGLFNVEGKLVLAHRLAYADAYEVEPPKPLDHTCHNGTDCPGGETCPHRACVNPAHLAASTPRDNLLASARTLASKFAEVTHCPAGHEYTPENTYEYRGRRNCRECGRERSREYQRRRRQG